MRIAANNRNNPVALFLIAVLVCGTVIGVESNPGPANPAEWKIVPPYCETRIKHGLDRSDPKVIKWMKVIGPDYLDIHHYCFAVVAEFRALRAEQARDRKYWYQRAEANYNYVIRTAEPGYVLLPEVHLKLGKLLIRMNQPARGIQELIKSMQLKPDYAPSYAALFDYYIDVGNTEQARETLNKGLELSPRSKRLKRRLRKLGDTP